MGGEVLDTWRTALLLAVTVGAPFIVGALLVGLLTSLLQAATQLQENVLSFAPKIMILGVILAVAGSWVLGQLVRFYGTVGEALIRIGSGAP